MQRTSRFVLGLVLAGLVTGCASSDRRDRPDPNAPPREASFDFDHDLTVDVPPGSRDVRIWLAMPRLDDAQEVSHWVVEANVDTEITRAADGVRYLYSEVDGPTDGPIEIRSRARLWRQETRRRPDAARARPATDSERERWAEFLAATASLPVDDATRASAIEITEGETNPVLVAERLYRWLVADRELALDELPAVYVALLRSVGIPAREVTGTLFKALLDDVMRDGGAHVWTEFWVADTGWIPVDVTLAAVFSRPEPEDEGAYRTRLLAAPDGYRGPDEAAVDYYFGNLDPRRITWGVGRDLLLSPPQRGAPVRALAAARVEVGEHALRDWSRRLVFREVH